MAFQHLILVLAIVTSTSLFGVVAEPCSPEAHAEMVIRYCFPGTSPSLLCCNALFSSLASGMGCICNISRTRLIMSADLGSDDIYGWFTGCGGNGDELAGVCSSDQDPGSPPPPPTQGQPAVPPPPPTQGQPAVPPNEPAQGKPWYSGLAKLGLVFLFVIVLVFGLLAVIACGGPAGREAAKLLDTARSIAKAIARRLQIPGWVQGLQQPQYPRSRRVGIADRVLSSSDSEIKKQQTFIDSCILSAPMVKVGNSNKCIPKRGRWNYNNKRLLQPVTIKQWAVVSFSANIELDWISTQLIKRGRKKGIVMEHPFTLIYEDDQSKRLSPMERVELMFQKVKENSLQPPEFLLCVLPERKKCDIYGPWKKKSLHEMGVATQCIAPSKTINDQYLTNVLLKINAKLGGMNSTLLLEHKAFQRVTQIPTLVLGIYVSNGGPDQANKPSIVAAVGNICWPQISRYKACVRTQNPKEEISDSLFKKQNGVHVEGLISDLLLDFCQTSQRKPAQIIIFRYGVCESQFCQVMNVEQKQIVKACKKMGLDPKFMVVTIQKKHHAYANLPKDIPPGTVLESTTEDPGQYDFFMWAHAVSPNIISRPTHYRVLLDEIGYSVDEIQNFVLSLSYLNQRSCTANSVVAPVHYARLAAAQMRQLIKFGAGPASLSSSSFAYQEVPLLHPAVRGSMFFC